jgi:hypothetical protein
VFNMGVAKVDRNVAYVASVYSNVFLFLRRML